MRSPRLLPALILGAFLALSASPVCQAADYNHRFVRNFPPGFNGMWYYADRFVDRIEPDKKVREYYRWDRFMSQQLGVYYPFIPIPYDWDYGTARTFDLPDYNANDWKD